MVSVKEAHLLMREFIPSGEEYLIRHIIFEFLDVILGAKYVCLSNEVFIFYLMNRFIEPRNPQLVFYAALDLKM